MFHSLRVSDPSAELLAIDCLLLVFRRLLKRCDLDFKFIDLGALRYNRNFHWGLQVLGYRKGSRFISAKSSLDTRLMASLWTRIFPDSRFRSKGI